MGWRFPRFTLKPEKRDTDRMLDQCWDTVFDVGLKIVPTLVQILIFCDVMSLPASNMRHLYFYVGYLTDCIPSRSGKLGLVNSAWWTIIRKIMCDNGSIIS